MNKLALLLFLVFPALFYSQIKKKQDPKVSLAIETYAYLKGQDAALEKVLLQFPKLRAKATAAEKNSKLLFNRAEQNIERFLADELEDSEFDKLQKGIDSLLNEQLKNPIEREKYALDFLKKVSERPNLIKDSLLLAGIRSFAYYDAPHEEITEGHTKIFNTKNHPKAQEASLKLSVPQSWLPLEAEMPETIQQFTSYWGRGSEKFLIVAYDLPAESTSFKLNKESVANLISPQTLLIRSENLAIDGKPGLMIEVEETINTGGQKLKIRMLQFMFVYKQKLYCLQGSIGPVEVNKNLASQIKKHEPLFRLIASQTQISEQL